MKIDRRAAAIRLCLALPPLPGLAAKAPPAPPVYGVVTAVVDGGSLWFKPFDQAPIQVRLRDIDAPALCQAWGEEAQRALAELALNKGAGVRAGGHDGAGRTVGTVVVDGVDLGRRMVEDGNAWSIRTRWDRGPLVKQERVAHALGRGLHAAGKAVPPAEFRKSHGPCAPAGTTAAR